MTLPLVTASVLAAVAVLVAAVRPDRRAAALWFAVAAIGQGASLSMITAGPAARYQHYLPLGTLMREHWPLLALMAGQAIAVGAAVGRSHLVRALVQRSGVRPWRVALAVALSLVTAATVSPSVSRYLTELAFAAVWQLLGLATVALAARSWKAPDGAADAAVPVRWSPSVAAGGTLVLALLLAVLSYERHPHIPDEVSYLHQAKYFLQGQLAMPPAPVPAAFDVDLMEYEADRWYSPMPPMWSVVLAAGIAVGLPWLLNPLLAAVNVLLTFRFLRHLYDERVARTAAWLLALSPWFISLGMSFMNHHLSLTCVLAAALGVSNARRTGRASWGLLAGLAIGAVSLIRPLDGAVIGVLMGAWAIGAGGTRLRVLPLAAMIAGVGIGGACVLPYNAALTGHPLTFPVNAYFSKHYTPNANAYGFGPDRGMGWDIDPNPGHSVVDGLINANLNTFGINTDLFGWVAGSLIFVAWFICAGPWRRADVVMAAGITGIVLAYFPYYFSGGPDFGARYWFPVIVPLVALTARGIHNMEATGGTRVWAAIGMLTVMTVGTYLPWRAADKYYGYRGMRPAVRQLASDHAFGADLILIRGRRFPDYASAFAENPADLRAPVPIYAWDRDPAVRHAVVEAYRDRRIWLIDGPSVTGSGYRLTAGPLDAATVLAAGRP